MSTVPYTPTTPSEGPRTGISEWAPSLPDIAEDESFADLVRDLSIYIEDVIETPHTWEQLRTGPGSQLLKPLITSISDRCHHLSIVSALLVCKWHYSSLEPDDRGILETRARACEIVAWRFLAHLSENELIDYLLYELPPPRCRQQHDELTHQDPSNLNSHKDIVHEHSNPDESSGLLSDLTARYSLSHSSYDPSYAGLNGVRADDKDDDPTTPFIHLNALEIAAVANAKRFLSQRTVQKVINGIWCGDIIFWDSMNAQTKKKARVYNKRKPIDPYTRLRVPKYQKVFEALFFATFLMLYYAVLLERHPERLGVVEILLYVWIAAFAYDEFGEYRDAGTLFYAADFWSLWDLGIIIVGVAFLIIRVVGLAKGDTDKIMNLAFDILSLEALFLVPRTCALLSLNPFFGTLIPCLKEMTKDFLKFLILIIILYMGFLTTFTLLARHEYTFTQMSWTLINVFFGSSYLGFDIATKISPVLGPPLMLIFVCMTNILLITSLISLLSNSLTKVMDHAREEYLLQYSIFVLEASASRRLTFYLPPLEATTFTHNPRDSRGESEAIGVGLEILPVMRSRKNLIPLIAFRPLRLCLSAEQMRSVRIMLLKATHFPYVAAIMLYEYAAQYVSHADDSWHSTSQGQTQRQKQFASKINSSRQARRAALPTRSDVSLGKSPIAGTGAYSKAAGADDLADMKQMMVKLGAQIDSLHLRLEHARRPSQTEGV